jgi:transcription antitermination factor NusG
MLLDVPIGDTWVIASVRAQSMGTIRDKLHAHGIYSFFPGRKVQRHRFGRKWTVERAEVPGYLFTKLNRVPNGDVWRERLAGFYGFVMERGQIVTVDAAIIRRLHGLSVEAQELEEARKDLLRVREGDMARFISGALAGHMVEVKDIGRVVTALLDGRTVKTDVGSLERVVV